MNCFKRFAHCSNFSMEYIIKFTAICITAAIFSLVIRKNNPEFALMIGAAVAVLCVWGAIELLQSVYAQIEQWLDTSLLDEEFFAPLIKCLGISIVSQFGVGICKDAGQSAASAGLELCGNMAAVWCLLPLINYLFRLIEDML